MVTVLIVNAAIKADMMSCDGGLA